VEKGREGKRNCDLSFCLPMRKKKKKGGIKTARDKKHVLKARGGKESPASFSSSEAGERKKGEKGGSAGSIVTRLH